mmetsp:Transcript_7312/g.6472  ORF Transcript_7312/g.6472 Transcript_7312/m.6472 type:complete len:86 (+) Transcript_7312:241-498(+)
MKLILQLLFIKDYLLENLLFKTGDKVKNFQNQFNKLSIFCCKFSDYLMPKRDGRVADESEFINKVQVYLKQLKKRKSERRINQLK